MKRIFKPLHFFSLKIKSVNKKISYLLFAFVVTMIWLSTGLALNYSGMKMFIIGTLNNLLTFSLFPFFRKIKSIFNAEKLHIWRHH